MLSNDNTIKAGEGSTNNQAQTINNNFGLSYADVRGIVTDVFNANFLHMKHQAAIVAGERASEITEKFLAKLQIDAPEAINEFANPGMQDSFFNAQKEYAISGDTEVADMLVEMLIERAKSPIRNRRRMILDESLKIAPKLTTEQMDILTFLVFQMKTQHNQLGTFENLISKISEYAGIIDTIDSENLNDNLNFMEYLRVGKIITGKFPSFPPLFRDRYPKFFNRGIAVEELMEEGITFPKSSEERLNDLFIKCFHDKDKILYKAESKLLLEGKLKAEGLPEDVIKSHIQLYDKNLMNEEEIASLIIRRIPSYAKLATLIDTTIINHFEISDVGLVIGVSNYQRKFNKKFDLSIWIK